MYLEYHENLIERLDVRIQRFIDKNKYKIDSFFRGFSNVNYSVRDSINILTMSGFFSDSPKVHSSIKDSINSLMRGPFTMNKEDIIKQLVEESPACLQSLLSYLDDKDIHPTLYLTFFEVFVKVWGRIIGSEFKADLIKRLDDEMMDSECFTDRISQLLNVLVGYFSDINITTSNSERITDIISSVLNGREMTDELKEVCRKSLKEAEIEDDEIGKWLDMKIIL
jgi:hypothetical protein